MKYFFLMALLIVGLFEVSGASAALPMTLSENGAKAYFTLILAKQFCSPAVGIGGELPKEVKAFRQLYQESDADAAFKNLLKSATIAGRLYGLCGIYYTDPIHFNKAVLPYQHLRLSVNTYSGCILASEQVSDIVGKTGTNVVRLKNRNQTIKEWTDETKNNGVLVDIIGGGWPSILKGSLK